MYIFLSYIYFFNVSVCLNLVNKISIPLESLKTRKEYYNIYIEVMCTYPLQVGPSRAVYGSLTNLQWGSYLC